MVAETSPLAATPQPLSAQPKKRRKALRILSAIAVLVVAWGALDLYGPRQSSLRDFDPDEVARLETDMWRAYYDKQRVRLFTQLAELMRGQYHFPYLRSNAVAYQAAKAAFVFKEGHSRSDYEKALPNLTSYYNSIKKVSGADFDVNRAAQLELEWWIVHRNRASVPAGSLDRALAELPAEIYQMPSGQFMEHARYRAEAMTIRDDKADQGGVTEEDWARIDTLLHQSWRSLWEAVRIQPA
jgi:hypothetical protein